MCGCSCDVGARFVFASVGCVFSSHIVFHLCNVCFRSVGPFASEGKVKGKGKVKRREEITKGGLSKGSRLGPQVRRDGELWAYSFAMFPLLRVGVSWNG